MDGGRNDEVVLEKQMKVAMQEDNHVWSHGYEYRIEDRLGEKARRRQQINKGWKEDVGMGWKSVSVRL
jgi:hypothetical protein